MHFMRRNAQKRHSKLPMWQKLPRFRNKLLFNFENIILAGCPCEDFDCSILDDFAESCKDPSGNQNYQKCAQVQKDELDYCIDGCEGPTCSQNCATEYYLAIENCPCANNCPCKSEVKRILNSIFSKFEKFIIL